MIALSEEQWIQFTKPFRSIYSWIGHPCFCHEVCSSRNIKFWLKFLMCVNALQGVLNERNLWGCRICKRQWLLGCANRLRIQRIWSRRVCHSGRQPTLACLKKFLQSSMMGFTTSVTLTNKSTEALPCTAFKKQTKKTGIGSARWNYTIEERFMKLWQQLLMFPRRTTTTEWKR